MSTGYRIEYSKSELIWIKKNCILPRKEAYKIFCEKFKRVDIKLFNYEALCKRNGWKTGRIGREGTHGIKVNRIKKNYKTFEKGRQPHNTQPIGYEYLNKYGYIEIKIEQGQRFVRKNVHLWEQRNGKVPEGMRLKCLDGNRQNCDPSNWEAIPRGLMPFLNGYHGHNYDEMPAEIKPVLLTLAKIKYMKSKIKG